MVKEVFQTTLTVTAGAYTANDNVGGKITLTDIAPMIGGTVTINSIIIADHDKQNATMDVTFFNADPASSTLTNDAATSIHDDDAGKVAGNVNLASSEYIDLGACSVVMATDIGMDITLVGSNDGYCALTTRDTPTYTATDHVQLTIEYTKGR